MIRRQQSSALMTLVLLCLFVCLLQACTDEVPPPPPEVQPIADVGSADQMINNSEAGVDLGADAGPGDLLAEVAPDGCVQCTKDSQCDDGDPCTKEVCGPSKCCTTTHASQGTTCDDMELCTRDDACDGKGKCAGAIYTCAPGQCDNSATCDGKGGCIATYKANATVCDDKNACTKDDACDGKGKCAGKSCGSTDGYLSVYQCAGHVIQRAFRIHKCDSSKGCIYKDIWKSQATCARTCASWCNSGATACGNAPAGTLSLTQSCTCDGTGGCKTNTLKKDLVAYWKLDEVALWSHALSATEAADLFNAGGVIK